MNFRIHLTLFALLFSSAVQSQTCASTSRNPYEWPGQNNWGFASNNHAGSIYNFATGAFTVYGDATNPMQSYEGTAAASDDQGNLLMWTNGRQVLDENLLQVHAGMLTGNENGATGVKGSASQGVMTVRHPLDPDNYYIITVDDALTSATNGMNYGVFNSVSKAVTGPTRLGSHRTTEGITATWHANGVDIWVVTQEAKSSKLHAFLLTCTGFISTPVTTTGMVETTVTADHERGGLSFNWTSDKLVSAYPIQPGDKIVELDFDNATGKFSNPVGGAPANRFPYDVTYSPDNSKILFSDNIGSVYSMTSPTGAATLIAGGGSGHSAIEIGADGSLYRSSLGGSFSKLAGSANGGGTLTPISLTNVNVSRGLPTMFIPPAEEPIITPVGPFCDTITAVDLSTIWMCSGIDAEDSIATPAGKPVSTYTGPGIVYSGSGIFSPLVAGVGIHEIIFTKCSVDDTIYIEVKECLQCIDTLKNITPEICAGPGGTLDLATLVDTANAKGYWTFGSVPSTATVNAVIDSSTTDTLFSAVDPTTKYGVYKMIYTVTKSPLTCKDSINIIVNKPPVISVNDSVICVGDPAALFTATSDSTVTIYLWGDNGSGSSQTTSGTVAGNYSVLVTDNNGCTGRDTGLLSINALPVISVNDSAICSDGGPALFTATSDTTAANYVWSDNGSGTNQTVSGVVAGNYSVLVIDVNGCVGRDTAVMTINRIPVVSVNDSAICAGDPVAMFTATSNSTVAKYVWGDNGTGSTQTTTGTTAGNYSVEITDNNGCIGRDTGVCTVNALPVVIVNDSTICSGGLVSALFTATSDTAAISYVWSENGTGIDPTSAGTVAGNYTATITDINGCVGSGTGALILSALPVLTVNDAEICTGDGAATFNVTSTSSITSYAWSDNGSGTGTTATGTTEGDYTVNIIDDNGCTGTAKGVLTVHALPTPDVILDVSICPSLSNTFDVSTFDDGNGPYTYLWVDGSTGPTMSKSTAGNYYVDVKDKFGCVARDFAILTVNSNLTVSIIGAPTIDICEGESATLISNYKTADGYNFAWAPGGETTETITVSASGTYDLHVDNGVGCQGDGTIDVVVHPMPIVSPGTATICSGGSATFGDNLGSGHNYSWTGIDVTTFSHTVTSGGLFTRVVTTTAGGCIDSSTYVITENTNPTVSLTDATVCDGTMVTLVDLSLTTGYTYSWSSGETSASISPTTNGIYTLTATDATTLCFGSGSANVVFNPSPSVTINDAIICDGFSHTIDGTTAGATYAWTPGSQTTPTISATTTGTYTVVVKVAGCEATDNMQLEVVSFPVSELDKTLEEQLICFEELDSSLSISAGTGSYNFLWNTGETTSDINVSTAGTYTVDISAGSGESTCSITDEITISAFCPFTFYVPNAFTPNGQKPNNVFYAYGTQILAFELIIYDRWGLVVFTSNDLYKGWDGTYKGREVQQDVYVWKANFKVETYDGSTEEHSKTGHVTVVR